MRTYIYILFISLLPNIIKAQYNIEKDPKKARIYSAIIPGAGQIYTKKYWKVPVIYAGLITSSYYIKENHDLYSLYKNTYINRINGKNNDEFTDTYSDNELINLTNYHKRNRDMSVLLFSLTYVLNIIDASVNAHLFNYDIHEDISLWIQPIYFTNNNMHSISLSIKL